MVKGSGKWTVKAVTPGALPPGPLGNAAEAAAEEDDEEDGSMALVDDLENSVYTRKLFLKVLDMNEEKLGRKGSADSATTAATRGRQDSAEPPTSADEIGMPRLAAAERDIPESASKPSRHRAGNARGSRKEDAGKPTKPMPTTYEAMPFPAFPPPMMYAPYGYGYYMLPPQDAHSYAAAVAMAQRAALTRWSPEHAEFKQTSRLKKQLEYYFSEKNLAGDIFLRSLMDAEGWVPLEKLMTFPMVKKLGADVSLSAKTLDDSTVVQVSEDKQSVRVLDAKLREQYPKMAAPSKEDSAEGK